ncbi:MAG: ATP12 family protein [Rhodospirillales bacterium]
MRRKYLYCSVVETTDGLAPALDGKTMRTPAGAPFVLSNRALADAIAAEWNAVGEKAEIDPKRMAVTRLATTAIDRVRAQRDKVIEEIAAYGRTDLLCYRAEQPVSLIERQNAGWTPWLDWAQTRFAVDLAVTQGVMPVAQDEVSIARLHQAVARFDDFALAALFNLTAMLGSLVLALAVLHDELEIERAADLAEIDAVFQAERWGEDNFAIKRRRDVRHDISQVGKFLALLSPGGS